MHNLTANQIAWARKHDWFWGVCPKGVVMRALDLAADGTIDTHYACYGDIASLRAAAGY